MFNNPCFRKRKASMIVQLRMLLFLLSQVTVLKGRLLK